MNKRIEIKSPRKLIESSLPLDVINVACAREKSIRHGHPSTLHLWWARRPLAAARAVIFAQMVNDPGWKQALEGRIPTPAEKSANTKKRNELFRLIEQLVQWENTSNKELFELAHKEILKSWEETCELNKDHPQASELFNPKKLPAFHDPFAGGGALPLEAQRLGLESYASDLNPVAVLINKAMIEIPPKFAGMPPINPEYQNNKEKKQLETWHGIQGLAEDIRYYGQWMKDEAEKRIGHLYPKVKITEEIIAGRPDLKKYLNRELTVIAWLWARTVKSPNPAFSNIDVPLVSTFVLSSKPGKETYVEPVITNSGYTFVVRQGISSNPEAAKMGTKAGRGSNFKCIMSGTPISGDYIKSEGRAGRIGSKLLAVVAEGEQSRVYFSPIQSHESITHDLVPDWEPEQELVGKSADQLPLYGYTKYKQIFTPRQLVALSTFSNLLTEVREKILADYKLTGAINDSVRIVDDGVGVRAYAEAVSVYLTFVVDKSCVYWNTLCPWLNQPKNEIVGNSFGRQALAMVWDYAEANPLSDSGGNLTKQIDYVIKTILFSCNNATHGNALQSDAANQVISLNKVVSTDPPYYDNICYADLSDFFYVWMRRSLKDVYPTLFTTVSTPKTEELIASPTRHTSRKAAEDFFLTGMTGAMHKISLQAHPSFPVSIYYAFKQSETNVNEGTTNTGWETFLAAVIKAGFAIVGTWPMRTEREGRMIGNDTNALASSIVLICRRRDDMQSKSISRRQFEEHIKREMPEHFDVMITGNEGRSPVGPVDLQQAAIGPGMGIFSSYKEVLKADGTPMSVREALLMINKELDTYLNSFGDPQTNFSLVWFELHGWENGAYGDADTLARAKGITIQDAESAGILVSRGGQVRLLRPSEYNKEWSVETDTKLPQWEALHRVALAYARGGQSAGELLAQLAEHGLNSEDLRQLAYRLYVFCERKGWAEDAGVYNTLMEAWGDISMHATNAASPVPQTEALF